MTLPYIPAGFEVSTPPPPQAVSLGVTDMGDGWTSEAFEDAGTGIQYIEYWNDGTGEMLWYASAGDGGDTLAATDRRWSEATGGGKWMWAGVAAGVGALGGIVAQRSKFPQYNAAVVAGLGAIVLGGVGYMAYGMAQKGSRVAGIGRRGRGRPQNVVSNGFNTPANVKRYW